MTRILVAFALVVTIMAPSAAAPGFEATFDAAPPQRVAVGEIVPGTTLARKAGEYGDRDVEHLVSALRNSIERELDRAGLLADATNAEAVLTLVIEDAKPNRPTAAQMGTGPRPLDARSVSRGGAELSALLADRDGAELGSFEYSWESPSVDASQRAVIWTDAERAFGRFARHVARAISAEGNAR